ncbi:MAG: rod shape-determining protein RodA [Proteobacteria bacterium]|nr:rod shape-determining protein RodA [Pseudomonadota bacterium]MBU1686003.1 rod shape-determining protein RodA [Pseudomonadota bacterium]
MFKFDRRLLLNFNWGILITVILLAIMGMMNLYSATYSPTGPSSFFINQGKYFLLGFALILFVVSVDYRFLISLNYPIYFLILILLCIALFFGGKVANTQRWINLGFVRLQPSELTKLALVINLASYYFRKDTGKGFTLKELIIPMLLTGIPFLLILKQPDLGTAMMLTIIFISMTLLVKVKWTTVLLLTSAGIAMIPTGWFFILKDYQKQRIRTLFDPEGDPLGTGYHIIQSKIAIGSGMIFGKGYLKGTQGHLNFLPERHTDFAFSIWAEEWGFIGSIGFLACYFFLILMALKIAGTARDKFGVLLAYGIAALLFWQAVINLGMILGLLPVVGMPLPFFSYGGSSLITSMVSVGLLLNIGMRRFLVGGQ